jgi:hypothetical protein
VTRTREEARRALESLTVLERLACTRLILRQLARSDPRIDAEIEKYGPEGSVRLWSARALGGGYVLPLAALVAGFAVAGVAVVTEILAGLMWIAGMLGVIRAVSASRAGRRWRAKRA